MITKISLADEVTAFVKTFKPGWDKQDILRAVLKHLEFETIFYVRDKQGFAGVLSLNITGNTAFVLDLFIRKDCERKGIIKYLAIEGWKRWRCCTHFVFQRPEKYPQRKPRAYELRKLFKGR